MSFSGLLFPAVPLFADNAFPPWLVPVGVVVVVFSAIIMVAIISARNERKRMEALRELADGLNFEFVAAGNASTLAELSHFNLFQHGRAQTIANLMEGDAQGLSIRLFDYSYIVGSGKHQQTFKQSVFLAFREGMQLPGFTLRPQSFWHRVGNFLGFKDIAFDTHPLFSKTYVLKGSDEDGIRAAFTDTVLDYFSNHPGLHVEASGEQLLFYRSERVKPENWRDFMAKGFEVLNLFSASE